MRRKVPGVSQSLKGTDKSVQSLVKGKICFVFVAILDLDLRVSTAIVYCVENGCLAKWVNTFIHTWDRIRISLSNDAMFLLVDAKFGIFVFLGNEIYASCPFGLWWFNNVSGEHLINFGFFGMSSFWAGTIRGGVLVLCLGSKVQWDGSQYWCILSSSHKLTRILKACWWMVSSRLGIWRILRLFFLQVYLGLSRFDLADMYILS